MQKSFIAISSLVHNQKTVYLTNGIDTPLFNENGLTVLEMIEFLHNLHRKRKHKSGIVFVCYAFSRDFEFIFSELSPALKNKLFQTRKVREDIEKLEFENDELQARIFQTKNENEKELLDFEKYTNSLALQELKEVEYKGYYLTLANGKFLTIRKGTKSITIFDVYGFFRKPIYDAAKDWLKQDIKLLAEKRKDVSLEIAKTIIELEPQIICELTETLNSQLLEQGIKLTKFHGAGALSSNILSVSKAKEDYKNFTCWRKTSIECHNASQQAFYGARTEQLKIGTLFDIKVYDINSAYAYASLFLPRFLRKPIFTKEYNIQPFSWWFVEYDFSSLDLYAGLLPNREKMGNFTNYKTKGKGYYYQPEIEFVLKHYPNCIKIRQGFYVPFEQAAFTKYILTIYELRKQLKKLGSPLEKVLKLALAGIYGKFCQHQGRGYYYNFRYAGFITSKVRAILLESSIKTQKESICFLTDAIHTTSVLPVACSDNIGDFRLKEYDSGTYYGLGVYDLTDKQGQHKQAHQGYNKFDFLTALHDIKDLRIYKGLQELFTGWNVYCEQLFNSCYLSNYAQNKKNNPFETGARLFDLSGVDLSESYIDSQIVKYYGGLESGLYKETNFKESNYALDSIRAKRI